MHPFNSGGAIEDPDLRDTFADVLQNQLTHAQVIVSQEHILSPAITKTILSTFEALTK